MSKETLIYMNPENKNKSSKYDNLQEKIDHTVKEVGGYWTPLSAFARVSEELGEISEIVLTQPLDKDALGSELTDLYIITTCLANQYCVKLSDEYKALGYNPYNGQRQANYFVDIQNIESIVPHLSQQIGKIARILNYYEGQKKKKASDETKSLREEIAKLHLLIFSVANLFDINISEVVEKNLLHSKKRDINRFDKSRDPITEDSLLHFQQVIDSTICPFAYNAKIWGAKSWNPSLTLQENISSNLSWLERFTKVCDSEQLDGFVIEVGLDKEIDLAYLGSILNQTLRQIAANNPTGYNCMELDIETPEWRFSFNGITFFVTTFTNMYGPNHSRYSPLEGSFFIFLQPEKSFDHNNIHRDNPKRNNIKQHIRESFERGSK